MPEKLVINKESLDILVGKVKEALDAADWEMPEDWVGSVEEYATAAAEEVIKNHPAFNTPVNAHQAELGDVVEQRSETALTDIARLGLAQKLGGSYQAKVMDDLQKKDHIVGTDAQGGYIVPTEDSTQLVDLVVKDSNVAPYLRQVRLMTNAINLPTMSAGLTAYTVAESTDAAGGSTATTESTATFGQVTLTVYRHGVVTYISNELIQDSNPEAENIIRSDITRQLGSYFDWEVFHGTGAAGADGTAGLITGLESKITSNVFTAGGSPTFESIVDLLSVEDNSRGPITMFTHHAARRELLKVTDNDGQFIYNPNVRSGDVAGIWGIPLVLNNRISKTLGAGSDTAIFAGTFGTSGLMGVKSGISLIVDPYTYANYNTTRLVAHVRLGFQVTNENHFAILNGITV